jgi:hypothetical protein
MMFHISFTGTRQGMTLIQKQQFFSIVFDVVKVHEDGEIWFHHGDCVGADKDAHDLISRLFPSIKIHLHPPVNERLRAFCRAHVSSPPKSYSERNKDIAHVGDLLIATPVGYQEEIRSGTWSTVRKALSLGRKICIIYLDGKLKWENDKNAFFREEIIRDDEHNK